MPHLIEKLLSRNDCGETGAHQAGICVPKGIIAIDFFPYLDPDELNPRTTLTMLDDANAQWSFEFIYYNNRLHDQGTRNEYRITWMTRFFREYGIKSGDTVLFIRGDDYSYRIKYLRANQPVAATPVQGTVRLRLASGWKVIDGEW